VPAYHHGSEIEALERAGLRCRFYDGDERLEPVEERLDGLVGRRTRALHLTHFFGFPQDTARWRRYCDERGFLLVEDAAQAWLASTDGAPVGSLGDLAVFCLYKTFGLPEGAVMLTRRPASSRSLDPRPGAVAIARKHASWGAGRSVLASRALKPFIRRPRAYDPERDRALRDPHAMPWATTRFLLRRLARVEASARRRHNYGLLLEALGESVPAPFRAVPVGASPFLFPVETDDKATLIESLRSEGIGALDVWSVRHPSLPPEGFPGAEERRRRTVGLPVHQELRPEDVDRLIAVVAGLLGVR